MINKNIKRFINNNILTNYFDSSKIISQNNIRVINKQLYYFSNNNSIKNPYQTLGVSRNATIDQIKKSYRTIAQKYHPDKNPDPKAQTLFVQAKQAYQILSDQDKRRQYDNQTTGSNFDSSSSSRGYGFDKNPFDQFNDNMFRDKTRTYHQTYTQGSNKKRKGQDILRTIQLNFIDSVKGKDIVLEYQKKATCKTCHGNKCKPGTAPTRCLACGGSGTTVYRQNSIVMHLECVRCKGIGLVIKHPCTDCKATGILSQIVKEQIKIPPGVQDNGTMTLKQKGNQSQNGPSGDLHLKFVIKKHPKFRKKGQDIITTQWITISQAALGSKKKIQTIWGQKQIQIPPGVTDGAQISIKNQGVGTMFGRGDHLVTVRILIPKKLTQNQKRIFMQLAKTQDQINVNQSQMNKQKQNLDDQNDEKDKDNSYMGRFKKIFK